MEGFASSPNPALPGGASMRIAELSEDRIVLMTHSYLPTVILTVGFLGMGSLLFAVVLTTLLTSNTDPTRWAVLLLPLFFTGLGVAFLLYLPHTHARAFDRPTRLLTCETHTCTRSTTTQVPFADIAEVLAQEGTAGLDDENTAFNVVVKRTSGEEVLIVDARDAARQQDVVALLQAFLDLPTNGEWPPALAGLLERLRRA
jgi:hypothetical protein